MAEDTARKQRGPGRPFEPGKSGNPSGRPKGARSKLGEAFLVDLHTAWAEKGIEAINRVIETRPQDFLKVVAMVIPKEMNLNLNPLTEWSDEQLAYVEAILAERASAEDEEADDEEDGDDASVQH